VQTETVSQIVKTSVVAIGPWAVVLVVIFVRIDHRILPFTLFGIIVILTDIPNVVWCRFDKGTSWWGWIDSLAVVIWRVGQFNFPCLLGDVRSHSQFSNGLLRIFLRLLTRRSKTLNNHIQAGPGQKREICPKAGEIPLDNGHEDQLKGS
jgi:hypothetical protein